MLCCADASEATWMLRIKTHGFPVQSMLFKVVSMASHSTSISLRSCWMRVSEEVLWPGLTVCAASWWLSPCPKRRMDWMEEVWKMNMWGSMEAACWEAQMSALQKPQLLKRPCYIKLQSLMAVWMEGNICQSFTYWRLVKLDKSKFAQFFVVLVVLATLTTAVTVILTPQEELILSPVDISLTMGFTAMPFILKPGLAVASDRLPIFGRKRTPYLVRCWGCQGWGSPFPPFLPVTLRLQVWSWWLAPTRVPVLHNPTQACWFGVLACSQKALFPQFLRGLPWAIQGRLTMIMTIISSPRTSHVNTCGFYLAAQHYGIWKFGRPSKLHDFLKWRGTCDQYPALSSHVQGFLSMNTFGRCLMSAVLLGSQIRLRPLRPWLFCFSNFRTVEVATSQARYGGGSCSQRRW